MTKSDEQCRRVARPALASGWWLPRPSGLLAASLLFAGCGKDDGPVVDNSHITAGQALGKFCHDLTNGQAKVELALEIGSPTLVRMTAVTETCSPTLGLPCTALPVGSLPARLLLGTKVLSSGALNLQPGGKYIFRARITDHPTIMLIPLDSKVACETTALDFTDGGVDASPTDDAGTDGGVPDGLTAGDSSPTDAASGAADAPEADAPELDAASSDTASTD